MRERIRNYEISARNSRSNTEIHESEVPMINSSQLPNDFDMDITSSINNSSFMNEINNERFVTSTPLPTNASGIHISHRSSNVSLYKVIYILK